MKNVALIMAAGNSSRCGFDKLLTQLNQITVLEKTLSTFQNCEAIDEIWVIGKDTEILGKIKGSITGGHSRFESVKNGISHCQAFYDQEIRIIVHNAANPFLLPADLNNGLKQAKDKENLIFGFFTPNAIKSVNKEGIVNNIIDREQIFETQTPQISTLSNFSQALEVFRVRTLNSNITSEFELKNQEPKDEAELLFLLEQAIHVFECSPTNTKITYATDFSLNQTDHNFRLGMGEDSHKFADKFEADKPFRLGGVDVSAGRLSSDGNSDGDLILHALCNALLSAVGDKTFDPIAAPICKAGETKSTAYLAATLKYLKTNGHSLNIQQVLISLEGLQPRIAPQHDAIVHNLATLLAINTSQIGLTYTTGEGLNDCGKGLGMNAKVIVTVIK